MNSTLKTIIDKLPDPDHLGNSEYRTIHEAICEIETEGMEDDEVLPFVESILDEYQSAIGLIRRSLTGAEPQPDPYWKLAPAVKARINNPNDWQHGKIVTVLEHYPATGVWKCLSGSQNRYFFSKELGPVD